MQLRLDVSAKGGGRVLATFADNDLQVRCTLRHGCFVMMQACKVAELCACALQRLPEPLLIRPVARAEYFEVSSADNVDVLLFVAAPMLL